MLWNIHNNQSVLDVNHYNDYLDSMHFAEAYSGEHYTSLKDTFERSYFNYIEAINIYQKFGIKGAMITSFGHLACLIVKYTLEACDKLTKEIIDHNLDKALVLYKQVLDVCSSPHHYYYEGLTWCYIAHIFIINNSFHQAQEALTEALILSNKSQSEGLKAFIYTIQTHIALEQNDIKEATIKALSSLKIHQFQKMHDILGILLIYWADIYLRNNDPVQAKTIFTLGSQYIDQSHSVYYASYYKGLAKKFQHLASQHQAPCIHIDEIIQNILSDYTNYPDYVYDFCF